MSVRGLPREPAAEVILCSSLVLRDSDMLLRSPDSSTPPKSVFLKPSIIHQFLFKVPVPPM
jgi:hypothetical protein